ncbi:homoserine acetyltransferase [Flagelloscypha sp. PMI_526]|nr:homoserine acetyltransferase [Flagelloscypha sp. PMI_526]
MSLRSLARTSLSRRLARWQHSIPSFPCVDAHKERAARLDPNNGPEPPYARPSPTSYHIFHSKEPLPLTYYPSQPLPAYQLAYETWGKLSPSRDNVILLQTGLSASSHAASTSLNPAPGWWEKFIGPGKALDTNQFFIVCTNVIGGCYGSTGPSSVSPDTGKPYATTFPIVSIFDMVRAQFKLIDELGIQQLFAVVGSSMGGMQSIASGWMFPDRVGRVVSISGTARSSPSSIALRFAQRSVLMADPNWNNGFYYDDLPPHIGMKLARQIATITYRSGPEWEQRFGRTLRQKSSSSQDEIRVPQLCPDFSIETYLDHQGEEFCLKYDANSLIYVSKAMDLFDMSKPALEELQLTSSALEPSPDQALGRSNPPHPHPTSTPAHSDILFTVDQQREMVDALRMAGNDKVSYYELGGVWGHDTFLLDVRGVGGVVRGFLQSSVF